MMTPTEHPNVTLARKMNDAMASGDMQTAADCLTDDIVWHSIGQAEPARGKGELQASMGAMADTTITWETHDVLANDEHIIGIGTATAVRGDETFTYRTAEIYHVRDGQISERWAFSDDTKAITDFFG